MTTNEIITSPDAAVLNDLSEAVGVIADEHGFRDDWKAAQGDIEATYIVGNKLMLVVDEVSEAHEELRLNGVGKDGRHMGKFGEELADIVIRVFELADMLQIPIGDEVIRKMLKNSEREHLHGKRF